MVRRSCCDVQDLAPPNTGRGLTGITFASDASGETPLAANFSLNFEDELLPPQRPKKPPDEPLIQDFETSVFHVPCATLNLRDGAFSSSSTMSL